MKVHFDFGGHGSLMPPLLVFEDALNVKLTEDEIKHLEEPYRPVAIAGHQ